jgi:hypothetical protein
VNPDGSVSCWFWDGVDCGIATSASASWDLDVTGQVGFPEGYLGALDFPALPPGSTIDSATFSWSVGEGIIPFPGSIGVEGSIVFNEVGSLGLQSVDGPCGLLAVSSDSDACSFTPGSTDETFYYPDFSGGGDAMLVAVIPSEPGDYSGGGDVLASATFTITEDFTPAPEPRSCGFLVGLGMLGFAVMRRKQRSPHRGPKKAPTQLHPELP